MSSGGTMRTKSRSTAKSSTVCTRGRKRMAPSSFSRVSHQVCIQRACKGTSSFLVHEMVSGSPQQGNDTQRGGERETVCQTPKTAKIPLTFLIFSGVVRSHTLSLKKRTSWICSQITSQQRHTDKTNAFSCRVRRAPEFNRELMYLLHC